LWFEEATGKRLVETRAKGTSSGRIGTVLSLVSKGVTLVTSSMYLCATVGAVPAAVSWFPTPSAGLFTIDELVVVEGVFTLHELRIEFEEFMEMFHLT
jgi:hypothetical protein